MKSLISWFAKNGVAANLLMAFIVFMGLFALTTVVLEVFPEMSTQTVSVTVPYLGAAPEEVEVAVCIRVEEAIQDVTGIRKLRSTASEGICSVVAELETDTDSRKALDDIKSRVDAIETFPEETEKPIIQEILIRRRVISLAISGDIDERSLKQLAEQARDELYASPDITQVDLAAVRPYEISIEVSEANLERYNLTFDDVVRAVRSSAIDLPGGAVKSAAGEILLRTKGQVYEGAAFERLPLATRPDGTRLLVGDVATVIDGFADTDLTARFDGKPMAEVQVFRVGDQSAIKIADHVKEYAQSLSETLPEGVEATTWQDDTLILRDRLDVLLRNGRMGLLLVFLVLALFLKLRLAGWVAVGIGVSFMGAVALMPVLGVTVNIISLFAFILVLGIVVDDAIVVGENIYRHFEEGQTGLIAAINGASEVAIPVTFSILTTLAAFWPLLAIPGPPGQFLRVIPLIVISCLVFSLIESLLIMPNHLSHLSHRQEERQPATGLRGLPRRLLAAWGRVQNRVTGGLTRLIKGFYEPFLDFAIEWRYATIAIGIALLMLVGGAVGGGWVTFEFFPEVEADNASATLEMPQGTPVHVTSAAIARIENAALELQRQLEVEGEGDSFRHVMASVGDQPFTRMQRQNGPGMGTSGGTTSAPHLGEVNIELAPAQVRSVEGQEILRRWRELADEVPDAVELNFSSSMISFGSAIDVQLTALDIDQLQSAARDLKQALRDYPGVMEITDSYRTGKRELELQITPRAEALGFTLADLARQVRQAFYGAEAQRIQRGRDDVRVMVRYTEEERGSLESLERMRLRQPGGGEVPFSFAGRVEPGRGFSSIQRTDRRRTLNVSADVDNAVANANEIVRDLEQDILPEILARHSGVGYSLAGEQEEQMRTFGALGKAFGIALVMIYGLLAIPFRSYLQPLIVMSAIPFGLVGAVFGHVMLGMSLTMLSLFGVIALTGVVVNDSLVMVDFINRRYRSGLPLNQAIREAGAARFRPILLTSLTTFVGLTPLLLEKSLQAQFLIPMATSLAFGVLFATAITLVLVPVLYRILEDLRPSHARNEEAPAMGGIPDPEYA